MTERICENMTQRDQDKNMKDQLRVVKAILKGFSIHLKGISDKE